MNEGLMTTMPLAPANTATTNNDMFGGGAGGFIWILLIFALLGGGNGGLFGNRNDGVAVSPATNLINNDFLYTQQKIDGLRQDLIGQTNQINQTLNSGFNSVNSGLCNLGHLVDTGFCGVNRNIDQVRFENAQNTCAITTAISASTQSIKDLINCNTMQDLRDRNVELASALNNSNQTAAIIEAIRPYPQASYLTANPQIPFYGGGYPCC